MAGSYEHGDDPSDLIKGGKFIDHPSLLYSSSRRTPLNVK
jgi:hypothetical protein